MEKELLVCPKCGNDKLQVYAKMEDMKVYEFFVQCQCGKESMNCKTVPTDIS